MIWELVWELVLKPVWELVLKPVWERVLNLMKTCFEADYRVNYNVNNRSSESLESPEPSQGHTYMGSGLSEPSQSHTYMGSELSGPSGSARAIWAKPFFPGRSANRRCLLKFIKFKLKYINIKLIL